VVQRCLIVDDSQAFLSSARALLESQGMTVTACALSGEEALAIAKRAQPDLALVDVELAGEDGFMLARSLIAQDPTLRVVLVSAYELEDVAELVVGCGASGFISKIALGKQAIEALWPDRDGTAASNNLRQALFAARRALDSRGEDGAARIALVNDVLTLATDGLRIDVEEFEEAAAEAERAPSIARHRTAIDLYTGELLPEDRFDGWASPRRQELRERHLVLLVDLALMLEEARDHVAAAAALRQALLDHKVLFFRDQPISSAEHVAFAAELQIFLGDAKAVGGLADHF